MDYLMEMDLDTLLKLAVEMDQQALHQLLERAMNVLEDMHLRRRDWHLHRDYGSSVVGADDAAGPQWLSARVRVRPRSNSFEHEYVRPWRRSRF